MSNVQTATVQLSVSDGTTMPAYVARPAGTDARPGILVIQEVFGVNSHIRSVTERFAGAGYTAIAPALFHRTDPTFEIGYTDMSKWAPHVQALTDAGLTADVRAAYQWLIAADGGKATKVGSTGYCMGGRVSFLADAELPLQAAVSYYGGGIAPGPHAGFPSLLDRAKDLHAPILLFWGGRDKHITKDMTRTIEDALIAAGKNYTQVTFSYADHGFFCDERASYEPTAAKQAWELTLGFFHAHLSEPEA